ncbi:MAG: cysteine-rich CWC family protein [Bacteroidales bacterium]|nr:cysteine-rich CWC family protein [Bacteroidales bacterium]MCB9012798.1 cysteine-rich CWC family protein [Bacteroidales bacterium]
MSKKTCPKCSASFECTGEEDCWCESVQIHKKDMLRIIGLYTDCLCPRCLGEFAEK